MPAIGASNTGGSILFSPRVIGTGNLMNCLRISRLPGESQFCRAIFGGKNSTRLFFVQSIRRHLGKTSPAA
jgi:hypothetical protein